MATAEEQWMSCGIQKEAESLRGWIAGVIVLEMSEEVLWQRGEQVQGKVIVLASLLWATGILSLSLYIYKVRKRGA